jgi:hypothetical protein
MRFSVNTLLLAMGVLAFGVAATKVPHPETPLLAGLAAPPAFGGTGRALGWFLESMGMSWTSPVEAPMGP